jgi:hypothetical protein
VRQRLLGAPLAFEGAAEHELGVVIARVVLDEPAQLLLGPAQLGGVEVGPRQQLPHRGVVGLGGDHRDERVGGFQWLAGVEKALGPFKLRVKIHGPITRCCSPVFPLG